MDKNRNGNGLEAVSQLTVGIDLKTQGFIERRYPDKDGVFLVKAGQVQDFPYAREHIALSHDSVGLYDCAEMEVCPAATVMFRVPSADYVEGPFALNTDEGQSLLKDALNKAALTNS